MRPPDLAVLVEPMLIVRRTLREQIVILHRRLLAIVRDDEVCRRLMTIPGVGPVVSLTYRATVDVPARFRKSKAVGAVFGLTCSKYQSGEVDRNGRISRCGDEMMRVMLYEAAQSMLRSKKWSWLKAWAIQIARRRGMKKAIVALARRLAVILHRRLLVIVRDDDVCRRLMTTPGVGPVVALTYRATVDVPARFRKSKAVGAVFGLTCAKYQSGEVDRNGRISRCGDEMMRVMLYEAAQSMLRSKKWSWLKAWAMQIARRRGMKKAIVALARRLAVIMHRIWVDGTEFRWTRERATAAA